MKIGDRLYTVYEDYFGRRRLVIKSTTILAIGNTLVKVGSGPGGERPGLPFGCRSQFTRKEIERRGYGLTEREAWEKYADRMQREINQGERELVTLRRNYHRAIEEAVR